MPRLADHPARTLLTLLAFLSGCCALAYEILYMRGLTTLLGDMLYVHAALLSTFLVGIALGAKFAWHAARWLWLLEILTGAYALAQPRIASWLGDQAVMATISASPTPTILCTIAFLCVPSLLIGFSIPLFSAYVKQREGSRLAFQSIYVAYNLGALCSILLVELVLVRRFGVSASLALVGAVNVFNGVLLLWMREVTPTPHAGERIRLARRVVAALFLASVASAVFQMFFLKLTYVVFHPHRENFAVGLSVTMFGIFLGAVLARRVPARFETVLALVPVTIGAVYWAYLPILRLHQATEGWANHSELAILAHKFAVGCLFALPPMILFGATLPVLMRREREVAAESGHLLWVCSMGNASGYLAYVLLGHPFLSSSALLAGLAGMTLVGSAIAAGFRWRPVEWGLAAAGVAALALMAGTWQERNFYLAQWIEELSPDDEVVLFKSGAESATLVREDGGDYEWITYNGHPSIDVQWGGVVNVAETISGVIPALAAPSLDRALVLGLGTGITAGATASVFVDTDVVEINDAFYDMMPRLASSNLDIGRNPAAHLYLSDGRSFLVGKEGLYDAIVNSIPAPTYYSASKIYTVEFYRRVAAALKPGGVFCVWLSSENMSERGLETVLAAIRESFERCDLRLMSRTYYMATCSNAPIEIRPFRDVPATLGLVDQIQAALPGFDLDEFFDDIRISENIFERYTPAPAQPNTDDHPVLEFMVVRSYQMGDMGDDPFVTQQELMNIDPVRASAIGGGERLAARANTFFYLRSEHFQANLLPALRADREAWEIWQAWGLGDDPLR